jgi:hypothetical protein
VRRAGQVEGVEHVLSAAALTAGEVAGLGRDADFVHRLLLVKDAKKALK